MNCMTRPARRARGADRRIQAQLRQFLFTIIQKKELNIYGSRNAMKKDLWS